MATPLSKLQRATTVISSSCLESNMSSSNNNKQTKSPILLFLYFHKAICNELDSLRQSALAFATGQSVVDVDALF